uniref:Uncharacterized protein n=1 Tax=Rhizophora mucronata TaxID=61149 RepID=A0A2P2QXB0_RHIMU
MAASVYNGKSGSEIVNNGG